MEPATQSSAVVGFLLDTANRVWGGLLLGVGLCIANYLMEKIFHIGLLKP